MKFFHFALIVSALVAPAAAGNGPPKRPRGLNPPHRPLPPHHPKRKPSHRYLKNNKQEIAKATTVARISCDNPNPLTLLDSGCPCFDQARIDALIDFSTTEYCSFSQYGETLPEDHPCYQYVDGENISLYASTPEQKTQENPPIFETLSAGFSVNMSTDPEYGGSYCYANTDLSKSSRSYQDYDDVSPAEVNNDFGEYHSYYVSKTLTADEYKACKDILNERKDMLPEKCFLSSDW